MDDEERKEDAGDEHGDRGDGDEDGIQVTGHTRQRLPQLASGYLYGSREDRRIQVREDK